MMIAARLNERASAAATTIRCTNSGVSSRASKPNVSRRGKKAPTAFGAISNRLVDGQSAVDRGHLTFFAGGIATSAALGTLGRGGTMSGEIAHMLRLNTAAQLLAKLVHSGLDV